MNNNNQISVAGPSFEQLTLEEMHSIQGSGDVQAETTPVCAAGVAGFATGVLIVLTLKRC